MVMKFLRYLFFIINIKTDSSQFRPFSITKHYNTEISLSSIAQSLGLYFPVLPCCWSNTGSQLFQYWSPGRSMLESLGLSLGLRLYFIVYPSSCHNTDSVLGRAQLPASLHSTSQHLVCQPVVQHWGSCPVSSQMFLWLVASFSWAKVFHWASEI